MLVMQHIIDHVRVTRKVLPRTDPSWRTSSYARSSVDAFFVDVAAGGAIGIGATAAHPSRISPDALQAELEGPVRDALMGADALSGETIRSTLRASGISARTLVAADLALWDLLGKIAGLPCYALWGGAVRQSLAVVRMVGIKPPDELTKTVQGLVDDGFTHFKIKIGTTVQQDVERIRRLREVCGSRIWIGVDGNGAYSVDDAIELSRSLERFEIGLLEQPVDAADLEGLARVTAASPIPIMADQVVEDVASALLVCQRKAAHVISIKATKMGTLGECRRVVEVCQAFGVRAHVGGSAGPSVPDAAQIQLAASLSGVDEECEVGEFLAVAQDPTAGVVIREGRALLSPAPGLGVTLSQPAASTLVAVR